MSDKASVLPTIPDADVPSGFATFTLAEFREGTYEGLFAMAKGDAMLEWFASGGPRLGRAWLWKDGAVPPLVPLFFAPELRVLVLWWGKPERLH